MIKTELAKDLCARLGKTIHDIVDIVSSSEDETSYYVLFDDSTYAILKDSDDSNPAR